MSYPKWQPFSRRDPTQPVCHKCKRGYGSKFDGLCSQCRGCDVHTARMREARGPLPWRHYPR